MPGMQLQEIRAHIKRHLSFYNKKDSDIDAEIVAAQRSLEAGCKLPPPLEGTFKPWFLASEIQDAITVIGDDRIKVPDPFTRVHEGFLGEVENAALWFVDTTLGTSAAWTELLKFEFDYIQRTFPGSGPPQVYASMGLYFRLRPFPDKEYPIKIITYNADLLVTSPTGQNKWMTYAPLLLAAEAGVSMATALRDGLARQDFSEMLAKQTLNVFIQTEERMNSNLRIVMGGAD